MEREREREKGVGRFWGEGRKQDKSRADSQSGAADTLSLSFAAADVPSVKNREDFCSGDKLSGRSLCVSPLRKMWASVKKARRNQAAALAFFFGLSRPRQGDLHYGGSRLQPV